MCEAKRNVRKPENPTLTIGKLIEGNDYDYVEYRMLIGKLPDQKDGIFAGHFCVENGKIIPLDGDVYHERDVVLAYEEWSDERIKKGLTIWVQG